MASRLIGSVARILPAVLVLTQAACGCDASIQFSVAVEVVDARSGRWAAEDAVGILEMRNVRDSLRASGFRGSPPNDTLTTLSSTVSLTGAYRLTIAKAGYFLWEDEGVVREDSCGPRTTYLTARLKPVG